MKIRELLILCLLTVWVCPVWALLTSEPFSDGPWSKEFRKDMAKIASEDGAEVEAVLLLMLEKHKEPHDQAEIQLHLALLYNQRTGMVDHSKAVKHFAKAQEFDLPPPARALSHALCGDSFRIMKEHGTALSQYLRGLSVCLEYDLPDAPPDLPPVGRYTADGPPGDPSIKAMREKHEKQVAARKRAWFQREMISRKQTLERQIVTLFDKIPFEETQFMKEAKSIIQDGKDVKDLISMITAHLKEKERQIFFAIQADDETKARIEELLNSSSVVHPEYHIRIVEPDPSIDYKLLEVQPDPTVDYKLRVIDPITKREITNLTKELQKWLPELLRDKREEGKKLQSP